MNNATRKQLLQRHRMSGFPGSILDVFRAYDQGIDLIGQFEQQQNMQVARTPQEQEQGLRPAHQAGNVSQSMIFPNVPPNTPFNTKGMKAPINIQKFDEQGHLVKSYENVPPGISNLPTGPQRGTVIETPANMQAGGLADIRVTPSLSDVAKNMAMREDSTLENIVEIFDPTGVSAWDDAYRAYNSMRDRGSYIPNVDEGLDMLGAMPVLGKAGKAINLYKKGHKPLKHFLTEAYNKGFRHTGRIASGIDGIEDETGFLDPKQTGGPKGDYNYERAKELGYKPDAAGHYPSVDHETGMLLKSKEHPTVKLEFMSQMLSPERKMIANPTGYFGENQLQYVPRKMQAAGAKDSIEGDIDTAKETTEKPTNQGIVNTQNALRSRLGIDLPADGEWSDEWENAYTNYLDSENSSLFSDTNTSLLPRLVPGNVSALMGDVIYNQTGLSIGHQWSAKEKEAMDKIAKRNIEKGKYFIEYEDYDTGTRYGDVGGGEAAGKTLLKAYDPAYNLKTTFGQAQIGIAPEWGERKEDTVIFDKYNFNDGKDHSIVNPISWGNVGKRLVQGDIYGTIRSIGREFGSPDDSGRDVTMVTNRQAGGPRKFQYGDFLTGRETYEPYQAPSDNTGVSIPPPPIPRLDPVSEETQQKIDEANKREYQEYLGSLPPGHPDRLGPQGITPMAFGPVEATLLGGAAIATGALGSTAAGIGSALKAPAMVGGAPILGGTVTAGNALNAGFAANSMIRLTGADGGENALDVVRDPNRSGWDKAGYFGMRGLELLPLAGAYSQGARGATSGLETSGRAGSNLKNRLRAGLQTAFDAPQNARRSLFGRTLTAEEVGQLTEAGRKYQVNIDPYFYGAKYLGSERKMLMNLPEEMRRSAVDFKRLYAPGSPNRQRISQAVGKELAGMPDDVINKNFNLFERSHPLTTKSDPIFQQAKAGSVSQRRGALQYAHDIKFNEQLSTPNRIHLSARPRKLQDGTRPNWGGVRFHNNNLHIFTGRVGKRENLRIFSGYGSSRKKMNYAKSIADHEIYHQGTGDLDLFKGMDVFNPLRRAAQRHVNTNIPLHYVGPGRSFESYRTYLSNMEELGARSYEARRQLAHFGDPYSIGGLNQMEQAIRGSSKAARRFNAIAGQTAMSGRTPTWVNTGNRYMNSLFNQDAGYRGRTFDILATPLKNRTVGMKPSQKHALASIDLLRTLPAVGGIGVGVGLSQQRGQ